MKVEYVQAVRKAYQADVANYGPRLDQYLCLPPFSKPSMFDYFWFKMQMSAILGSHEATWAYGAFAKLHPKLGVPGLGKLVKASSSNPGGWAHDMEALYRLRLELLDWIEKIALAEGD